MKIRYKHQQFQEAAARAVCRAFTGQPKSDGTSTHLIDQGKGRLPIPVKGFGNLPLNIGPEALCDNVRAVQMEQDLQPIEHLEGDPKLPAFTIEMETGTGKTYTYIKTMYELWRKYGWSKFVVVVPSIAIREGVAKSLGDMADHFAAEYGQRMQWFVYNSKQLSKIDSYASDAGLHAMVINTQAFNASLNEEKNRAGRAGDNAARIIFSRRDEFGSRRPIDILSQTRPIMIIDEPQSVLGADKGNATRKGIRLFRPLFMLLYSATHRKADVQNMLFRLDAIDAYNRRLVKRVEVRGIRQIGTTATGGYVYLEEIVVGRGNPRARLGFDQKTATGTRQALRLVEEGFDLGAQSGGLAEYDHGYVVERIDGAAGTVRLLNGTVLREGDAIGAVNDDLLRRIQIRETIKTHLERERALFPRHIKVLSLFFIDHVDSYRHYTDSGTEKGKFALMFEEEYRRALQELAPEFGDETYLRWLSDARNAPERVHDGYFSRDKKGRVVESKDKEGENEERGFSLIMRDKERLLSQDEPVRFVFSHSALKEGWDNPNVFQICTLKNTSNEMKKRQEVGRGMRLCVDADGERQDADVLGEHVQDTNVLTVVASESYEQFAGQLQHEIAEACQSRPVVITAALFADRDMQTQSGETVRVGTQKAADIVEELVIGGYVRKGKLTQKYFDDKKAAALNFGDVDDLRAAIVRRLDTVFNPDDLRPGNGRGKTEAHINKDNFDKREWQELWKRINTRTYYNVNFETPKLIEKAIAEIDKHLNVTEIRIVVEGGAMEKIDDKEALEAATAMEAGKVRTIRVAEAVGDNVSYDLVGELVQTTGLTRRTIVAILKGLRPTTFYQFKKNPEEFIIKTSRIINDCKATSVVEHICYKRLGQTFSTDIFDAATLKGAIGVDAIASQKSLYDLVVVDSKGVEKSFAEALEQEDDVVVYTKLPGRFYINTPMGHYNPDWAVAFREGTARHVYFVAETKGNAIDPSAMRGAEKAKIECATRHFAAISDGEVVYSVVNTFKELSDMVMK